MVNGTSIMSWLPRMPICPPRATWPPANGSAGSPLGLAASALTAVASSSMTPSAAWAVTATEQQTAKKVD
ncbi:hypothetical protein D3C80_1506880 [compost metagenome]